MGTVCFASEESEHKIQELEKLLEEQDAEKLALKKRLKEERERQKKIKTKAREYEDPRRVKRKIEQLSNEKKQVFKTMLKERKNVSTLEDQIEDYKRQIREMEHQLESLKYEKDTAQKRAHAERVHQKLRNLKSEPPPHHGHASSQQPNNNFMGMGSVLAGIKIPVVDVPAFHAANSQPVAFRNSRIHKRDSRANGSERSNSPTGGTIGTMTSDVGSSSDDTDDSKIQHAETLILDASCDPASEATHVYSWLHASNLDTKRNRRQLKQRIGSLLTARSEGYRQKLMEVYREEYGRSMEKDIRKAIGKGHTQTIVHGMLMTRAQYDAALIHECVANWDLEPIADIICCRTMRQLKELNEAYTKKNKLSVRKQLQALALKDKKKTMVKVLGGILDLNRKEIVEVEMNDVNQDLNFVQTAKKFHGDSKERLIMIFTNNSVQYIKVLNDQFLIKSKDSLATFIDKKLGPKSTAGYFCKTRIEYALDTPDFFAVRIRNYGKQFKKNQKKISDIFTQRLELDLDVIQRVWKMKKYGDGKDLKEWVLAKTSGSKAGYFLSKMLDNCGRYATFNKNDSNQPRKSKIEQITSGYR